VYNAESTLLHNIFELLDILPEIAARFEILIVDDGSNDHTEEMAHELSRRYPQVRVVRHSHRRGPAASLQTGMQHTVGDIVFVHDEATPIRATELRSLWNLRYDPELVVARTESCRQSPDLPAWDFRTARGNSAARPPRAPQPSGTQMIRREGMHELAALEAARLAGGLHRSHPHPRRSEVAAVTLP
jgi:hypothetical protein